MEIKNRSIITQNDFQKMFEQNYKRTSFKITISVIIVALIFSILRFTVDTIDDMSYYVIIASFGVCLGLFIFYKRLPQISLKQNSNLGDAITYNYTFYDDKFVVISFLKGQTSSSEILYSSLYDFVVYDDFCQIFISKAQAYFCKYSGFETEKDKNIFLETLSKYSRKKSQKEYLKYKKKQDKGKDTQPKTSDDDKPNDRASETGDSKADTIKTEVSDSETAKSETDENNG